MSVSQEICEYFSDLIKPARNVRAPGVAGTQAFYSSRVECTDKNTGGNVLSIMVKVASSKSCKEVYNNRPRSFIDGKKNSLELFRHCKELNEVIRALV